MPATSPAHALGLILHGPSKTANPKIVLLDYRDPATFSALWLHGLESGKARIEGQTIDLADPNKNILLIGNDPPDGIFDSKIPALAGINFRSHFTATSWVAAWRLKFPKALAAVAVVDPHPAGFASGTARALQPLLGLSDKVGKRLLPLTAVLNAPSLREICRWLTESAHAISGIMAGTLIELLRSTIWNGLTSTSEQHHALSNVLGPMILSGRPDVDWDSAPADRPKLLLRRLLESCDLVSWVDTKSTPSAAQSDQQDGLGLDFLLLDDQAAQGWTEWVKECLPGGANRLHSLADPTSVLKALRDALRLANLPKERLSDARFALKLPGLLEADNPVLLLDLRLFAGNPGAELVFFRSMLPLVDHFTDKPNLAWPGFCNGDPRFAAAKVAVEKGTLNADSEEHHEALTWLPRLVALVDMSMPIVLFSSTGRRDIVEAFKAYGNIITIFSKPRLQDLRNQPGLSRDHIQTWARDLRAAVREARRWLTARKAIRLLCHDQVAKELNAARETCAGFEYFEVYHDESGEVERSLFRVTSLLAGYLDQDSAQEYHEHFPFRFYGKDCLTKRPGTQDASPAEFARLDTERWQGFWRELAEYVPRFIACSLFRDEDTEIGGQPDALFDPAGLDNINRDLLALQWESLLVDVFPALFPHLFDETCQAINPVALRLCGATRWRPIPLQAKTLGEAIVVANEFIHTLRDRWGMKILWDLRLRGWQKGEEVDLWVSKDSATGELKMPGYADPAHIRPPFTVLWRSFGEDSFWSLAAEVLQGRRDSSHFPRLCQWIESARGYVLRYGDDIHSIDGPHMHYLADVCGGGLMHVDKESQRVSMTEPPFHEPQGRGAVGFRSRLLRILNGNRLLDQGGCAAEALMAFHGLDHEHPRDLAYLALAERLQLVIPQLTGPDLERFLAMVDRPPAWLGKNRLLTPSRVAKVEQKAPPPAPPTPVAANPAPTSRSPREPAAPVTQLGRANPWVVLRYPSFYPYCKDSIAWHDLPGFEVRQYKNGAICVFANSDTFPEPTKLSSFTRPASTQMMGDGQPGGSPWRPTGAEWAKYAGKRTTEY